MGVIQGSPPIQGHAAEPLPLVPWMKRPGPVTAALGGGGVYAFEDFFFPTGFEALIMASAALPWAFWALGESSFLASLP